MNTDSTAYCAGASAGHVRRDGDAYRLRTRDAG